MTEFGRFEIPVLRKLLPLEYSIAHLIINGNSLSLPLLQQLLVFDVEHFLVLFSHIFEHLEKHHQVELDLHLRRVFAGQTLAVFVALQQVGVCLFEATCLHAHFAEKQVITVNALIVNFDVFVDLDGVFGVPDGFLVLRQFPLAH